MFNTHRYYLIQPEPKADTGDKKSAATADEDSKVLVNMISTEVCKMWFFEELDQLQFDTFDSIKIKTFKLTARLRF